jgi:ABC-2 type transport system permease protein
MNWRGTWTLLSKEVSRFMKVLVQTVLTPVVTALLYLLVFGHALAQRTAADPQLSFSAFLAPGLIMMSMIQNAFANSSSSIAQSKMMGSLIFMLLAPLSALECLIAYVLAAMLRGLLVGIGIYLVIRCLMPLPWPALIWALAFACLGCGALGALGLIAGILADKYEHLSAFQNFVVLPLSFLAGVFYSIRTLPSPARELSHFNPFFYMIDGFRFAFIGVSDVSVRMSLGVVALFFVAVGVIAWYLLDRGIKLRN